VNDFDDDDDVKVVVTAAIRLRFDCDSTAIPFDCLSKVIKVTVT